MQFFTALKSHKFLYFFIAFYCVFLVAFSRYAPNLDDLWLWIEIIAKNQNEIYMSFRPQIARFAPFALLELLFLMQISTSPYLFFAFNALLFVIFCVIYLKILGILSLPFRTAIIALLSLSTAFVIVFFGICYFEKVQIVWIALFMLFTLRALQNPTPKNQLFAIITLNIALYYKEPTFLAALAFGAVMLLYAWQNRGQNQSKDLAKFAFYVIFSACNFAILYYFLVVDYVNVPYSTLVAKGVVEVIFDYILNDGIIFFGICGLFAWRAFLVAFKNAKIEAFYDGCLAASLAYFLAFMVLKMSAPYYLLPCYVLGVPPLLYFGRKYWKNLFVKIVLIFGIFLFFSQNLPNGIYKMVDLKAQGVQFQRTLDFVASHLRDNPQGADIYFDGIGRGRDIYAFEVGMRPFWFALHLEKMRGIANFDLRTNAPNGADFSVDKKSRFTLSNSDIVSAPKSGDLIIVSNMRVFAESNMVDFAKFGADSVNSLSDSADFGRDSAKNSADSAMILSDSVKFGADSAPKGELIFKSGFPTIPHITLISLMKYFCSAESNPFATPLQTQVFLVE
ncbi:hypothetical protein ACWIUD_10800 [Helicobacter sp. 23-1044]